MAQFVKTVYESNSGAKPRLLVLFQPTDEGVLHTEEELKAALVGAEKELRLSWLLPGTGQTLQSMKKQPNEETRHMTGLRKQLDALQLDFTTLQIQHKGTQEVCTTLQVAIEDAESRATEYQKAFSQSQTDLQAGQKQLVDATQKCAKLSEELQTSHNELDTVRRACETAKTEISTLKSELLALRKPPIVPPTIRPLNEPESLRPQTKPDNTTDFSARLRNEPRKP